QKTKDLIIGKGEDWRDNSHFKYSLAFAWADWLIIFPLFVIGYWGVFIFHNTLNFNLLSILLVK
ncbi:hypothetical protein ACFLSE_06930, partial [Bacteroidota bacterium]